MKPKICSTLFNHSRVKDRTEDDKNGFRFVSHCRCGQNYVKSIVLTDNDLLADINLHSHSFPVDENVSNRMEVQV